MPELSEDYIVRGLGKDFADGKESAWNAGHLGWEDPLEKGGEGNGNPLQCSCLENPRDSGAWWAALCGVTQSWTRLKRLSSGSLEKGTATHSSILASRFYGRRSQAGYNPWSRKEPDTTGWLSLSVFWREYGPSSLACVQRSKTIRFALHHTHSAIHLVRSKTIALLSPSLYRVSFTAGTS